MKRCVKSMSAVRVFPQSAASLRKSHLVQRHKFFVYGNVNWLDGSVLEFLPTSKFAVFDERQILQVNIVRILIITINKCTQSFSSGLSTCKQFRIDVETAADAVE